MGVIVKVVDVILFVYFLLMGIIAPLIDAQTCLPLEYYPEVLVDLKSWYSNEYGDYLVLEKPIFFVGLVWMELFVLWPISIVNLFGIIYAKSWFNTTCLIYGVSLATSMVAIISELIASDKSSNKLKMVYYPFMGFAILAVVRGLLSSSCKPQTINKRSVVSKNKRA